MNIFGKKGEGKAVKYLKKNGYEILDTNYNTKAGEIDIIAKKDDVTVFVEVKTRSGENYGMGYEAVSPQKINKIINTAKIYIASIGYETACRFDVISIDSGKITHITNAFGE